MSAASAEVLKLAHQLGVEADRLGFLVALPAEDVRRLRAQVGAALFQADRQRFDKIAAASKLLPVAFAAKVTEHALSPLLAARTAEVLDPGRAVDMVGRLSQRYVADVSTAMDPSRAPEVVAAVPPATVAAVAAELAARRQWVVMGGFVSHISLPALDVVVSAMDGEQLLRVGYVMDDLSRLDAIVRMLAPVQLGEIVDAAARLDLWSELEALVAASSDHSRARLGDAFVAAPAATRERAEAALAAGLVGPAASAVLTA
jgi:hypothetical protein